MRGPAMTLTTQCGSSVASRLGLMSGLMDDLPLTLVNGNELYTQSQTNVAYSVRLAVLADKYGETSGR